MSTLAQSRREQALQRSDTSEALHRCRVYLAAGDSRKIAIRKAAAWLHYDCALGAFTYCKEAIRAALDATSPTCRT